MKSARTPSPATLRVLHALLSQPAADRYGYELIKSTGLHSGTLYPVLMRLHDRGLLAARWRPSPEAGKPPRHAYRLTDAGVTFAMSALAKARHAAKAIGRRSRA